MEQAAPKLRLAAAMWSSAGDEFIVFRQPPPLQPLPEEEYAAFTVDSDLWDLPSAELGLLAGDAKNMVVQDADSVSGKLDLSRLDLNAAVNQVSLKVGIASEVLLQWKVIKYVEEADFGPGAPTSTLYVSTSLRSNKEMLTDSCIWISKERATKLLSKVERSSPRMGQHVAGILQQSDMSSNFSIPIQFQEYPIGVAVVPMKSNTGPPFSKTNLVVVQAAKDVVAPVNNGSLICADALIVDPGCCSEVYSELSDLVDSLPKKLVVFLTHHHFDHITGLPVVQKCNPDAILLAHKNTMQRIPKEYWSLNYIYVTGGDKIRVGNHQLEVIFAPGHTDGHVGLLHVDTNALIVGDHCVGQGSAVLDGTSGGNMKDYFDTTYRFLELSPHVIIPMHGKINLWPQQMLCGYLKHRRDRESSILKIMEAGAQTLFELVARCYADTHKRMWLAASQNVRLHVDYLEVQQRLPKGFSIERFRRSFPESVAELELLKKASIS